MDGRPNPTEATLSRTIAKLQANWPDAYIYYCSSGTEEVTDLSDKVRLLSYKPDHIPCFGRLDVAILIDSTQHRKIVEGCHPDADIYDREPADTITGNDQPLTAFAQR